MKTQDLLNALSKTELEELSQQENIVKSPILGKLIIELTLSLDKDISKEVLFQKVYSECYNSKKDARLRNRLKALNQIIRDFMVEKELKKSIENIHVYNANLINAYQQRGLESTMDLEFDQLANYAEKELQLESLCKMLSAKINLDVSVKHKTLKNIELIESSTQKHFDTTVLFALRLFRNAEKKHTNTQLNKALNTEKGIGVNWENAVKQVNPITKEIDLTTLIGKDPYADADYFLSKTFLEPKVVDRLKYLKLALKNLEGNDYPDLKYSKLKLHLLDGIVFHHIQCGDWKIALKYLTEQEKMFTKDKPSVGYILQSMHCLIATGRYKKAIELVSIKANKKHIKSSSFSTNIYLLKAFAHAWLGELKIAGEIVNQQDASLDYVKVIGRLISLISYFKEGDLDFAEREYVNALKALRGRPKTKFYMRMSTTFKLMGKIIRGFRQPKSSIKADLVKASKKFALSQYPEEHYLRESVPYNAILLELENMIKMEKN